MFEKHRANLQHIAMAEPGLYLKHTLIKIAGGIVIGTIAGIVYDKKILFPAYEKTLYDRT